MHDSPHLYKVGVPDHAAVLQPHVPKGLHDVINLLAALLQRLLRSLSTVNNMQMECCVLTRSLARVPCINSESPLNKCVRGLQWFNCHTD